jgi:hypothetical protein
MKATILILYLSYLISFISSKGNEKAPKTYITEITDEKLASVVEALRGEADEYQKEFLRMILNPEKADLNYDRKISPIELKKCVENMLLPKGEESALKVHPELIKQAKAGIELFITNINYGLNYKQFQELMTRIRTEHFVDLDRAKANSEASDANVELPNDL